MKQSPLRPCYLDVNARRPHDAPGLRRTGSAIETTPRFPVGPLSSQSGPGAGESTARSISDTKLNSQARAPSDDDDDDDVVSEDIHCTVAAPHDDRLSISFSSWRNVPRKHLGLRKAMRKGGEKEREREKREKGGREKFAIFIPA